MCSAAGKPATSLPNERTEPFERSKGEFLVLNRSVKASCVSRVTNYQLKGF